jgi:hypothetical protein
MFTYDSKPTRGDIWSRGSKGELLHFISDENYLDNLINLVNLENFSLTEYEDSYPNQTDFREVELLELLEDDRADQLIDWWFYKYRDNSTTPYWDLVSTCKINGKKGFLLVEAKAHLNELSQTPCIATSRNKHHIEAALNVINESLGTSLSISTSYQLSNRIAYAWWLASQGYPTILMYIGFIDCEHWRAKDGFKKEEDWIKAFDSYAGLINSVNLFKKENWIKTRKSNFICINRSIKSVMLPKEMINV